jgi:hypothetical protein
MEIASKPIGQTVAIVADGDFADANVIHQRAVVDQLTGVVGKTIAAKSVSGMLDEAVAMNQAAIPTTAVAHHQPGHAGSAPLTHASLSERPFGALRVDPSKFGRRDSVSPGGHSAASAIIASRRTDGSRQLCHSMRLRITINEITLCGGGVYTNASCRRRDATQC